MLALAMELGTEQAWEGAFASFAKGTRPVRSVSKLFPLVKSFGLNDATPCRPNPTQLIGIVPDQTIHTELDPASAGANRNPQSAGLTHLDLFPIIILHLQTA
jgi:hypothetical protein